MLVETIASARRSGSTLAHRDLFISSFSVTASMIQSAFATRSRFWSKFPGVISAAEESRKKAPGRCLMAV